MADITRHGVTLAQALQEAAASAPVTRVMLYAYELWHTSFADPIRFVNDTQDLVAILEATAPRDPGGLVTFIACPISRQVPEESDRASNPSVSLSRPDVSGIIKSALDAARGSTAAWTLIERLYASDDLSEPALNPVLTFEVTAFDISAGQASLSASYGDWINVALPRSTFRRVHYPGLQR